MSETTGSERELEDQLGQNEQHQAPLQQQDGTADDDDHHLPPLNISNDDLAPLHVAAAAPRRGRPPATRRSGEVPQPQKVRVPRGPKATWFSCLVQAGVIGEFVRLSSGGTLVFLDPLSPDFGQHLVDAGLARQVNPSKDPLANLKLTLRRHGYVMGRTVDKTRTRPLVFIPEIVLDEDPWCVDNIAATVAHVSGYYKVRNKVMNKTGVLKSAQKPQSQPQSQPQPLHQHPQHQHQHLHPDQSLPLPGVDSLPSVSVAVDGLDGGVRAHDPSPARPCSLPFKEHEGAGGGGAGGGGAGGGGAGGGGAGGGGAGGGGAGGGGRRMRFSLISLA
jgi:uncharacterized membrane protein YgcG